jgi:hypothetical protein
MGKDACGKRDNSKILAKIGNSARLFYDLVLKKLEEAREKRLEHGFRVFSCWPLLLFELASEATL